jgi:hypothetical protein
MGFHGNEVNDAIDYAYVIEGRSCKDGIMQKEIAAQFKSLEHNN